jgi:hypothetical protein
MTVPENKLHVLTHSLKERGVGFAVVGSCLGETRKNFDKGNGKWT